MSATKNSKQAPPRIQHVHVQLTDDEIYAVRMCVADCGAKQIGKFCREILMSEITRRYEELRRRGIRRSLTQGSVR